MRSPTSDAAARLERLQRFLRVDPDNGALLADACDAALAAGLPRQAGELLASATRLGLVAWEWRLRAARAALAGGRLRDAEADLTQLLAERPDDAVCAHDLAWARFALQDHAACRDVLRPWLHRPLPAEVLGSLQSLWLRANHAQGRVEEAWDWLRTERAAGRLQEAARGPASLLAIDADDFAAARELAGGGRDPESLVAAATVALATGAAARARGLLQPLVQRQPRQGRAWLTLGLAALQAQDVTGARQCFEQAVLLLPAHIGSWHALGWACLFQQDAAAAQCAFERALDLDRNFAESHGALALVLALVGERTRAGHHLARAERLDPAQVTGAYARAVLAGEAAVPRRVQALARRLLARPGFFGRPLAAALGS